MEKIKLTESERTSLIKSGAFYRIAYIGCEGLNTETVCTTIRRTTYYLGVTIENLHGSSVIYHYNVLAFKKGLRGATNELVNRSAKSPATFAEKNQSKTFN